MVVSYPVTPLETLLNNSFPKSQQRPLLIPCVLLDFLAYFFGGNKALENCIVIFLITSCRKNDKKLLRCFCCLSPHFFSTGERGEAIIGALILIWSSHRTQSFIHPCCYFLTIDIVDFDQTAACKFWMIPVTSLALACSLWQLPPCYHQLLRFWV